MATIKWAGLPTSRSTVLTTQLDSLANGSRTAAGTAVDNGTNLDTYGWLKLSAAAFGTNPSAGAYVEVHMLQALDGTNYPDGSNTIDPGVDTTILTIPILANTSAQVKQVGPFLLPPCPIKFILVNQTGQAFASSGSTLTLYTDNYSVA